MPSLTFGFLVCGYLPGLPIAFAIYFAISALQSQSCLASLISNENFWLAYLLVTPLIFGLLLDGIRHGIGIIYNTCPCLKTHLKFLEFFLWEKLTPEDLKKAAERHLLKEIYEQYSTHYHMFEFAYNLFLSNIISIIIIWFTPDHELNDYILILFILAMVGLSVGWVYKMETKILLNKWF